MRTINLLIAAALLVPAAQAYQFQITPFLSCIDVDQKNGTMTAYFGYESFEAEVTQLLIGGENGNNRFLPSPSNRQQPSIFFPGYQDKAFRVTIPTGDLIWLFNGYSVTVTPSSQRCTPPASLPPAALSVSYFQKLGAVGAKGTLSWLITNPPPGLSLSTDGTLNGSPTQAGSFILNVTASDGITTAPATYALTVNSALTVSDPLSTRPPGFVPQFRTVSQVGGSNSALATCDSNEFVIIGGGNCVVPNQNTVQGRIASSQISGNGWAVTCSGGTAVAMAVCAK